MFESALVELSKVKAPSILLSDFNYFMNKAVNQYINKRYNIYDTSQQTTDDLRVLKATAILDAKPVYEENKDSSYGTLDLNKEKLAKLFKGTYTIDLPKDYLHMLSCVCVYEMQQPNKCYDTGDYVQFKATRLTADLWASIINDYYNRPLPERPYFYIHNVNTSSEYPYNPVTTTIEDNKVVNETGTDMKGYYDVGVGKSLDKIGGSPDKVNPGQTHGTNFNRVINIKDVSPGKSSTVERMAANRFGNPSAIRCEIRYGRDNSVYKLVHVMIDYIKTPQYIRLTQTQVDLTEDTSQIIEFPDYVCQEIINELVMLVMENSADPRLQTHIPVTQSIANPAQQQTQTTTK